MWLPSRDLPGNPDPGMGSNTFPVQKPSKMALKGRLQWTCLLCRDSDPGSGLDAGPRKGCPRHGKGDHVKKVRV